MTRLMLMTFFTEKRWEPRTSHPHESPKVMTVPLIVLAALSVLGGVLLLGDWIVDWLAPVVGRAEHQEPPVAGARCSPCSWCWSSPSASPSPGSPIGQARGAAEAPTEVSVVTRAARADLYGDAFNDALVVRPGTRSWSPA